MILKQLLSSQTISEQVKVNVMQKVVGNWQKLSDICGIKNSPSLLDSGGQVTLICQNYFEREIPFNIKTKDGEKVDAPKSIWVYR